MSPCERAWKIRKSHGRTASCDYLFRHNKQKHLGGGGIRPPPGQIGLKLTPLFNRVGQSRLLLCSVSPQRFNDGNWNFPSVKRPLTKESIKTPLSHYMLLTAEKLSHCSIPLLSQSSCPSTRQNGNSIGDPFFNRTIEVHRYYVVFIDYEKIWPNILFHKGQYYKKKKFRVSE